MAITVYGIKNCDTMKKARDWLDERKMAYTFHDYKASGIEKATLQNWVKDVGWEKLLNRAGTTFKKLLKREGQYRSGQGDRLDDGAAFDDQAACDHRRQKTACRI